MKALGIVLIVLAVISVPVSCGVLFGTSFAQKGVTVLEDTEVPLGTKTTLSATAIDGTQAIGVTLVAPGATSDIDVTADVTVSGTRTPTKHTIQIKRGAPGVNAYQPYRAPPEAKPDVTHFFWRSPLLQAEPGAKLTLDVLLEVRPDGPPAGQVTPTSAKIGINGTPPFPKQIFVGAVGVPITLLALGISMLIRSRRPKT